MLECMINNKIIDHVSSYIYDYWTSPIWFMSNKSTIQQLLMFLHDIFNSCCWQTDVI